MLDSIIRFSIKNKLFIGLLTLLLIGWGVYSLRQLPIDAVPDITNNQVQIITSTPTLAGQEVEQFVTYPIEQSLASLPDVEEIRSISRFGLSVVTVVFDDKVDIYFARQLINERLKKATEQIPEGVGTPELAPVSTGLGEIYQYVLHPRPGSEAKYSTADLRTMQDWIVSRQLLGVPGVAEVNSFGGLVKQYEVAVNPARLRAMDVSIAEILTALEKNNQNTGGAYIDKKPNAYFIRGIGLVTSLEDVGNIVIKTAGGIPVLVRHVAEVRFGSAVRYGAMTRNGEGEVVGGIVMMLKGANSAAVVALVKARMETIAAALPADIAIEPFSDRTRLVDQAIGTVKTNLMEGALIVIFVLVLFLGNLRAGLIVASAIPLALLFALGLMNVFGVSANLMSLGAIDFGLIVDGAVIIVEATLHHLGVRKSTARLTQSEMDKEVFFATSRIRSSAAFGEIIILIVYIPILTLTGIEGKMFRPMAQTVGFAILGALILSLTYIPMMCALVLPKQISHRQNFSDRMMAFFERAYSPLLASAIRWKKTVVGIAAALLVFTAFLFSRMGGEFLPQLQEGDFAFHCILPQGASLSQSIETSMQASRILKTFPEVVEVVGKTGSAEVPTDPMPPEASDLFIVLKDKKDWTTTHDYNGLARLMAEKLEAALPGVFFETSQPIQMRFNELMTGVRQDVAIKIFGENMDTLAAIAPHIARIVQSVPGVTAPQIERTSGLPQITIRYDRARIAAYGLNIKDVNQTVSAAFAGQSAGVVFENERRFDLVVRLDSSARASINDVAGLYVPTANGNQIPLSQLATVAFEEGPAQISHEDTRRRGVEGFNVGGRDVQSVVRDIQEKLREYQLPTGYYVTYGGTFENLEQASDRLGIAVPAALLLIFTLLYFTFHSLKQAVLIFTAIPMSAIGGVAALALRGMPFSISAGIGFIALFGVAVLNGIVLIGTFNQLAKEGWEDVIARIREGTHMRLRPVLMTATVASLGFLPMAISSGAGAEVQKPLATVVIGGLITATLLTLIVLPLLYLIFTKKDKPRPGGPVVAALLLLFCGALPDPAQAQTATPPVRISLNDAYNRALVNNLQLRSSEVAIQRARALTGTAHALPKTGFFVENEDLRPSDRQGILKIGISQALEWPAVYGARRRLYEAQAQSLTYARQVRTLEIRKTLQTAYYTLWYHQSRQQLWQRLDSLYSTLAAAAVLRVRTGESAGLDSIAAQAKSAEIRVQLSQIAAEMQVQQSILQTVLNTDSLFLPDAGRLGRAGIPVRLPEPESHPSLLVQRQSIAIAKADLLVTRSSLLPEFSGRFFTQRLYGLPDPMSGFSVSVGIPLPGLNGYRAKVRAATLEQDYQQSILAYETQALQAQTRQAQQLLEKDRQLVDYYETTGLAQAEAIIQAANLSYQAGEISFAELSAFLTQAIDIQRNYLDVLNQYNQAAIALTYYLNP